MCEFCNMQCDSRRHLSNHRRFCKNNPDREKTKEKREKADDQGGYCSICDIPYKKRSAYH
ncbi:hypothetical protein PHYSODRAFT_378000, partial [Phytophthora sojae]